MHSPYTRSPRHWLKEASEIVPLCSYTQMQISISAYAREPHQYTIIQWQPNLTRLLSRTQLPFSPKIHGERDQIASVRHLQEEHLL